MSGRLIYLAGPLDGLGKFDGTAWYDEFMAVRPADVVGFMPGRAYIGASCETAGAADRANRAVIAVSLGIVANLAGPGRALGTIREIEFAKSLAKPVIAIGDLSASLAAHDLTTVSDLQGAIDQLVAGRVR